MADGDTQTQKAAKAEPRAGRWTWRGLWRALHRDLGHLAVGLTFVYALSGIAVNHVGDWEPNYSEYQRTHELGPLAPGDDAAQARDALGRLGVAGAPRDVFRNGPADLEIALDQRTIHVDPATGHATEEGREPRFFLRVANWLHENRGKRAWTYVADGYAAGLLLLAVTGLFMLPVRKGLLGRGGVLLLLGVALPIAYVELSGGPEGQRADRAARPTPGDSP